MDESRIFEPESPKTERCESLAPESVPARLGLSAGLIVDNQVMA